MSNLVTACYDCNRGKSAKVVEFEPPKYPEIFKKSHPLTGKFGHTLEREDGEVFANYQFQILDVQDDIATVQLFSWGIPPGPNGTMVLSVGELMNRERCALYGDQESWIRYGDLSGQRRIAKIRRLRAG